MLVQQVKPPSNDATQKKKIRRLDGVRSTLYNPIPEHFGLPKIIDSMRDIFKQYEDMQVNSIVPETDSLDYVNSVTILHDTVTTSWSADDICFLILNISCWSDILVLYVFSSTLPVLACYMVAAAG